MQKNKRDEIINEKDEEDIDGDEPNKKQFRLGEGIGKHGQGIINPVQVEVMPTQGGIGSVPK